MAPESLQITPLTLNSILSHLAAGHPLTAAMQDQLQTLLLLDAPRAKVWDITAENAEMVVEHRSRLFQEVYPELDDLCRTRFGWNHCPLELVWDLWLPLAMQLAWHQVLGRTLIQGVLGSQGTGKTTMAEALTLILRHLGLQVCRLSLDDLYKTYADRQALQQVDPRFRWRGPPGTHDVDLGLQVLHQLRHACCEHPILIPRFDKAAYNGAGDRTDPEWITCADIVLFEGWFVGVRPIDPAHFEHAPPPIVTEADRAFARDVNSKLQEYVPLWNQLDRLIVLYPTDYHLSKQWRKRAEQQMVASGRSGMTDDEIDQFVDYFWRSLHPELFITPLLQDAEHVDMVIEINENHAPGRIYCPGGCDASASEAIAAAANPTRSSDKSS